MKASSRRNIKNGNQYNKYFNAPINGVIELPSGDVYDTLERIQTLVNQTIDQTKEISPVLKANTLQQTLSNVWNFLYGHIQYKEDDKGVEQLRTPQRSWFDRKSGIDCDCFSIFISSILTNLEIPHSLRITEYASKGYYQHVYIVVPLDGQNIKGRNTYIVIDPVVDSFNYEEDFTKKHDRKMKIPHQVLNGLGGLEAVAFGSEFEEGVNGLGAIETTDDVINNTKHHLENTLSFLNSDMSNDGVDGQADSEVLKEQVEYLLEVWDDPIARDAAMEEMEEMEELGEGDALEDEDTSVDGLGRFNFRRNFRKHNINAIKKVKMLRARRRRQRRIVPAVIRRNSLPKAIKNLTVKHNQVAQHRSVKRKASKIVRRQNLPNPINVHKTKLNCSCSPVNGVDGLGRRRRRRRKRRFFRSIRNAVKKVHNFHKKVAKKVIKAHRNIAKKVIAKIPPGVKKVVKKMVKAIVKWNPLTMSLRVGILAALKINLGKITEKIKLGYLTEQQAIAKGLDLTEWRKVVRALQAALKYWRVLGGSNERFKQAVRNGRHGGIGVVEGLGCAGACTTASAATGVAALLAKIGSFLKKINFKKLVKAGGKIKTFMDKRKAKRSANNNVTVVDTPSETVHYEEAPKSNSRNEGTPKGKDNTLLYVAGGIGAATAIYLASRPSKPLNGTTKKKVAKKTTTKKKVKEATI